MPRNKFRRQYLYVSDAQYLTSNVDLSQHYVSKSTLSSSSSASASSFRDKKQQAAINDNKNKNNNNNFVQLQVLDLEHLHEQEDESSSDSYNQLNENIRLAINDILLSKNLTNADNNEHSLQATSKSKKNSRKQEDRDDGELVLNNSKEDVVESSTNCNIDSTSNSNSNSNENVDTTVERKRTLKDLDMGSSSGSSSDSGVFATSGHSSSWSTSSLVDDINATINNPSNNHRHHRNNNNNNNIHHHHHHQHHHHQHHHHHRHSNNSSNSSNNSSSSNNNNNHHYHHHHSNRQQKFLDTSNSDGSQSDSSTITITNATNSCSSDESDFVAESDCHCRRRYDNDIVCLEGERFGLNSAANNGLKKIDCPLENNIIIKEASEREEFGQCALDWYKESHLNYHKNKLVALISAGMTSGSDKKYVTDTVKNLYDLGYEVCVFIRRGVGGLKLNSPKFFSPAKWRDFESAIKSVRQQRPGANLIAVGFSFGSIELCRYLSMSGKQSLVDAALLISCPFDPEAGGRNMRKRLLNRKIDAYLAKNLGKQLYQAMQSTTTNTNTLGTNAEKFSDDTKQVVYDVNNNNNLAISNLNGSLVNLAQLPKIKSLVDFEDNYNRVLQNYPSSEAYADDSRLSDHLKYIRTPTLCLSSEDDFMAPLRLLPLKEIELNENLCMILTKRGGHMAFIDGLLWPKKPYFAQRIIATYMEAVKCRLIQSRAGARSSTSSPSSSSAGSSIVIEMLDKQQQEQQQCQLKDNFNENFDRRLRNQLNKSKISCKNEPPTFNDNNNNNNAHHHQLTNEVEVH